MRLASPGSGARARSSEKNKSRLFIAMIYSLQNPGWSYNADDIVSRGDGGNSIFPIVYIAPQIRASKTEEWMGGIKMQLHFQWPRGTHPFYLLAHVDFSSFEGRNFGEGCQRVMFPCKYCRGRAEELTVTKQISPYKVRLVNSSKSERPKLRMRRARKEWAFSESPRDELLFLICYLWV